MNPGEIYRLKDGTRVQLSVGKRHYTRPNDEPNTAVIRVKDGHDLWGVNPEDLLTEKQWLKLKKA